MDSDLDRDIEAPAEAEAKRDAPSKVRGELLLHGGLVLALSLVFLPVLLHPTEVLYNDISDLLSSHLPYRHLLAESLREHGRIPRYNPTSFGGIPLVGDPQAGLVYPPNWLHTLGPGPGGAAWFGWSILLHLCVGAFGVAWWLRGHGHGWAARLAGALAFSLSGKWLFHVVVAGHVIFAPLAWVPWQLALIDRLQPLPRGSGRLAAPLVACALLAACTALTITGFHPQLLLYSQTLVLLYAVAWLVGRRTLGDAARGSGMLAAAAVLGLGLAAVHLLPILDSLDEFVRGNGLSYRGAEQRSLAPAQLLAMLLPVQNRIAWEFSVFLGAFAVVLACFSPWRRAHRRTTVLLLVIFASLLLFALGSHAPLHRWAYDHIPGYNLFRLPRRVLIIAGIPVAYLAASGLDALCHSPPTRSKWLLATVGVGASLLLLSMTPSDGIPWAAAALVFPALCLAPWPSPVRAWLPMLAALLIFADGARFIAPRIETRPLDAILGTNRVAKAIAGPLGQGRVLALNGNAQGVISALPPTYATAAGIEALRGYNPLVPLATHRFLLEGVARSKVRRDAATTIPSRPIRSRKHLDLFNTRWVASYRRQSVRGLALRQTFSGQRLFFFQRFGQLSRPRDVFLYENTRRLPRAYLVRSARLVADVDQAIKVASRFNPRREVLVEDRNLSQRSYPGDFQPVNVVHHGDELFMKVDAGDGGFLVLSEIAYRGWRADDDGAPIVIHRANGIFQTVQLGPGHHSLHFEYLPRSFEVGRAISAISVVLVLALLVFGLRSRTRTNARARALVRMHGSSPSGSA